MGIRVAETSDRVEVIPRGVPFVTVEAIARIARVEIAHQTVARDFGEDRGGRDGRAAPVAANDGPLRHGESGNAKGVHEHQAGAAG